MEYKIRAMTLGEILDTSIKVFMDNFLLFLLIGSTWMIAFVPFIALGLGAIFGLAAFDPKLQNAQFWEAGGIALGVVVVVCVFLMLFLQFLATAALTKAISEKYLGHPANWVDSYKAALNRFLPLLGTQALAGIAIFFGFLLLLVPGIILALAFYILPPIVLVERTSGIECLKRAWFLMKGNKLKTFLIMFIIGIAQQLAHFGGALFSFVPFLPPVLTLAIMAVFFVFGQVAVTIVYFHTRCEKEGFDMELLARDITSTSSYASNLA